MADLQQSFALIRQRRNPARTGFRNLRLVQGEDVALSVTIYNQDTDASPVDVSQSQPVLSIFPDCLSEGSHRWGWGDYGWGLGGNSTPILQIPGSLSSTVGEMDFALASGLTAVLGGRYRFYIFDSAYGSVTVLGTGVMQVDGSAYAQPGLLGIQNTPALPGYFAPDGSAPGTYYAIDGDTTGQFIGPDGGNAAPGLQ